MKAKHKTLLGLPIKGDINLSDALKPQKPWTEFQAALESLMGTPGFLGVRWSQWTPYFNDGDPCRFHAGIESYGGGFRFDTVPEDGGDGEDGYVSYDLDYFPNVTPEQKRAADAFERVVESGEHYAKLQEYFGDHACVEVTKEKITVSFLDHE